MGVRRECGAFGLYDTREMGQSTLPAQHIAGNARQHSWTQSRVGSDHCFILWVKFSGKASRKSWAVMAAKFSLGPNWAQSAQPFCKVVRPTQGVSGPLGAPSHGHEPGSCKGRVKKDPLKMSSIQTLADLTAQTNFV